jgi:hypothetical protein
MLHNRGASLSGARVKRFVVEVAGYSWLVHGGFRDGRFDTHLVELRGAVRLDVEVDQELRLQMQQAIARFLGREIREVKKVKADLFLI